MILAPIHWPPWTTQNSPVKKKLIFKELLSQHESKHGKTLKPINNRNPENKVPKLTQCPQCGAPHGYIYFNDGKKRSQLKCKVCDFLFQLHKRFQRTHSYFCPYCTKHLYAWKEQETATIYKCGNRQCPHRVQKLNDLNDDEKKIRPGLLSQFKINYQYRDYHFEVAQLKVAEPDRPTISLHRIHNDINIFALILTLHISYAITARKTAHMLKNIWQIKVSHQTVLNYTKTAAYYCHKFNMQHKGSIDDINAGDETYIKVKGAWHYVWFFICSVSKKISAYHFSDNRGTMAAITTMLETVRTAKEGQKITFVCDGNPSYQSALHFVNAKIKALCCSLKSVIGLKNLDEQSTQYRSHKQIIERLNRTYKYHVQSQNGFDTISGAVAKLVLFVTHYNFLRPHKSLADKTPIELPGISGLPTTQAKWIKILSLAA